MMVWPAQPDWLRRYSVFKRATSALEEIVVAQKSIYFNSLKKSTVYKTL